MSFYKQYRFKPKWYFVLATICLCTLFIYLGFWQLDRAAEKQYLQTIFTERLQQKPISLTSLPKDTDIRYLPVTITGHYDNAHSILLDNKIHAHRVGYEVLTPFSLQAECHKSHKSAICDDGQIVLVNRGWIPAGNDRHILPAIPEIKNEQTITGYIYLAPGKSFTLGHPIEEKINWPLRVQTLDTQLITKELNYSLYPFIVLLSANDNSGFVRDWQPIAGSPDKHRGYAVQWFAFTFVLIIIFFSLTVRKTK